MEGKKRKGGFQLTLRQTSIPENSRFRVVMRRGRKIVGSKGATDLLLSRKERGRGGRESYTFPPGRSFLACWHK